MRRAPDELDTHCSGIGCAALWYFVFVLVFVLLVAMVTSLRASMSVLFAYARPWRDCKYLHGHALWRTHDAMRVSTRERYLSARVYARRARVESSACNPQERAGQTGDVGAVALANTFMSIPVRNTTLSKVDISGARVARAAAPSFSRGTLHTIVTVFSASRKR